MASISDALCLLFCAALWSTADALKCFTNKVGLDWTIYVQFILLHCCGSNRSKVSEYAVVCSRQEMQKRAASEVKP